MSEGRQIFRQQSLEKLQSPDRLDQMLRIVKPQTWIVVVAVATGFVLLLMWGIFGSVTVSAQGAAVLVKPKKVVLFQSPVAGQIDKILVSVNDKVEEGQLLATLKLPALKKQLEARAQHAGAGEAPPIRS